VQVEKEELLRALRHSQWDQKSKCRVSCRLTEGFSFRGLRRALVQGGSQICFRHRLEIYGVNHYFETVFGVHSKHLPGEHGLCHKGSPVQTKPPQLIVLPVNMFPVPSNRPNLVFTAGKHSFQELVTSISGGLVARNSDLSPRRAEQSRCHLILTVRRQEIYE